MKKIVSLCLFSVAFGAILCINQKSSALPNPWIDCKDDISCARDKAGFNFPLRVENYSVKAMKNMIEITFPLDKYRIATVRKSQNQNKIADGNGIADISGVYTNPIYNKTIKLKNGVIFNTKGDKNKITAANFAAESGYYSIYSSKGLNLKDINYFYNLLEEAEAKKYSEINTKTIEELQDLRRVDDIVEPVYTQDCFPKTLKKKGVTEKCFERANLGEDTFCSKSEIKMIEDYYKKGQENDPLNDGSGNFCAN